VNIEPDFVVSAREADSLAMLTPRAGLLAAINC